MAHAWKACWAHGWAHTRRFRRVAQQRGGRAAGSRIPHCDENSAGIFIASSAGGAAAFCPACTIPDSAKARHALPVGFSMACSPTAAVEARRIRLVAYGARLESVLGASPRGFESPILRRFPPLSCWFFGPFEASDGPVPHKNSSSYVGRNSQLARRRTSKTVAPSTRSDNTSSQPPSIHWKVQNRLSGW